MGGRRYWQPLSPVILLRGGEVSQEQFDPLIFIFREAVGLRVEC